NILPGAKVDYVSGVTNSTGDEDTVYTAILHAPQVDFFFTDLVTGVANYGRASIIPHYLFGFPTHMGKKRVPDVRYNDCYRVAFLSCQPPRQKTWPVVQRSHCLKDFPFCFWRYATALV